MRQVSSQKFEDPAQGEAALRAKLGQLNKDLKESFRALEDECK